MNIFLPISFFTFVHVLLYFCCFLNTMSLLNRSLTFPHGAMSWSVNGVCLSIETRKLISN